MAETKRWIITVSRAEPINEVRAKIQDAGFEIDQVHDLIGTITGSATEDVADAVRAIPGVVDVEEELIIDIGPPGEDETW